MSEALASLVGDKIKLSECAKTFFDAVVNPFGAQLPAQVPDDYHHLTMCLNDWVDDMTVTLDVPADKNVSGIAFMFIAGSNSLSTLTTLGSQTYCVVVLPLDNNGHILGNNAGTGLTVITPTNYATINGAATGTDWDASLVDSFRIYSCGLRIWPTIEVITDSTTLAVTTFWAGSLSTNSVSRSANENTNFYNVLRQSNYVQMYPNDLGCTARLDPFDDEKFLDMRSITNWTQQQNFDTSMVLFPIVAAQFTNSSSVNGDTVPVRFMMNCWLEGQLVQPTPLFPTPSCTDLNYHLLRHLVSDNPKIFPIVHEGHSFSSFLENASKLGSLLGDAMVISSHILPKQYAAPVSIAGRGISAGSRIVQSVVKSRNRQFQPLSTPNQRPGLLMSVKKRARQRKRRRARSAAK